MYKNIRFFNKVLKRLKKRKTLFDMEEISSDELIRIVARLKQSLVIVNGDLVIQKSVEAEIGNIINNHNQIVQDDESR